MDAPRAEAERSDELSDPLLDSKADRLALELWRLPTILGFVEAFQADLDPERDFWEQAVERMVHWVRMSGALLVHEADRPEARVVFHHAAPAPHLDEVLPFEDWDAEASRGASVPDPLARDVLEDALDCHRYEVFPESVPRQLAQRGIRNYMLLPMASVARAQRLLLLYNAPENKPFDVLTYRTCEAICRMLNGMVQHLLPGLGNGGVPASLAVQLAVQVSQQFAKLDRARLLVGVYPADEAASLLEMVWDKCKDENRRELLRSAVQRIFGENWEDEAHVLDRTTHWTAGEREYAVRAYEELGKIGVAARLLTGLPKAQSTRTSAAKSATKPAAGAPKPRMASAKKPVAKTGGSTAGRAKAEGERKAARTRGKR